MTCVFTKLLRCVLVGTLSAIACAKPPPPDPPDYLGLAAATGKRLEPWSLEHSDWLGARCRVTGAGGPWVPIHFAQGNVILVVDPRSDEIPQWETHECDEPNWHGKCGLWRGGAPLWVAYECATPPPWPSTELEALRAVDR